MSARLRQVDLAQLRPNEPVSGWVTLANPQYPGKPAGAVKYVCAAPWARCAPSPAFLRAARSALAPHAGAAWRAGHCR